MEKSKINLYLNTRLRSNFKKKKLIVKLFYIYFFFTIFDGILRKWIFPSLSTPLMVVKQAIAILILLKGIQYYSKFNLWEKSFFIIGIIVFITSLILGHGNIYVAIWGCLPFWFGLTLCHIISKILSYNDLHFIGKILIGFVPINTMLILAQLILPVNHWINYRGTEIKEYLLGRSAIDLAGGFRPPGIFMATGTLGLFLVLSSSFILYYLFINTKLLNKQYLIIAYVCCWISSICAVSRSCIFYMIGISIYAIYFAGIKNYKTAIKVIKYIALFIIFFIPFLFTPLGDKAIKNMGNRFENASHSTVGTQKNSLEGNIYDIYNRTISYLIDALIDPRTMDGETIPLFGYGQGMSTQVGGRLLNEGKIAKNAGFSLAEWDGLRIICESGLLLGWIILYIRLGYAFRFISSLKSYSYKNMNMTVFIYPIFLLSFFVMNTWGNVTNANMAFLFGGLFLAAERIEQKRYYYLLQKRKKRDYENQCNIKKQTASFRSSTRIKC